MSTQAIQNFRVRLKRLRQKKMSQPLYAKKILINRVLKSFSRNDR